MHRRLSTSPPQLQLQLLRPGQDGPSFHGGHLSRELSSRKTKLALEALVSPPIFCAVTKREQKEAAAGSRKEKKRNL